jgi:hypothetical protein
MERSLHVFMVLHEEMDKGWVYLGGGMGIRSRALVRLKNLDSGKRRSIFCEYVELERPDVDYYNSTTRGRIEIPPGSFSDVLVISKWYRSALDIPRRPSAGPWTVHLDVKPAKLPGWNSVRAAVMHPDPAIRVGTRLGVLGAWLGMVALFPALVAAITGVCPRLGARPDLTLLCFAVLTGALGCWACWGVKR